MVVEEKKDQAIEIRKSGSITLYSSRYCKVVSIWRVVMAFST
jgi:hypothetical protein